MLILGIYKFFSNSLGIRFGKLSSDFENFEKSRKMCQSLECQSLGDDGIKYACFIGNQPISYVYQNFYQNFNRNWRWIATL